jgi:tetratricopeptide (TPR) repeat protein
MGSSSLPIPSQNAGQSSLKLYGPSRIKEIREPSDVQAMAELPRLVITIDIAARKNARVFQKLRSYFNKGRKTASPSALAGAFHQIDTPSYPPEIATFPALVSSGDLAAAEKVCRNCLAQNPNDAWANYALASVLSEQQDFIGAEHLLKRAIRLNPGPRDFYIRLAKSLTRQTKYHEAARVYEALTARRPHDAHAHFLLGLMLSMTFDRRAIAAAERGILLEGESAGNLIKLGQAHQALGQTPAAIDAYRRALSLDTSLLYIALRLAELLTAMGETQEASIFREHATRGINRQSRDSMFRWAVHMDRHGMRKDASEIYRETTRTFPDDWTTHEQLGISLADIGEYEEACVHLKKALRIDPTQKRIKDHLENLQRTLDTYIPTIKRLAAAPPGTKRNATEDMIVVRGGMDASFIDIARHYRAAHPGIFLILSTWEDCPAHVLSAVKDYFDDVVLNRRPSSAGMNNVNYQIACAASGVNRAIELGAHRILVTRTDIALLREDSIARMRQELESYDATVARNFGLKGRLLISDTYTLYLPLYHASDIFMYGHASDVQRFWSLDAFTDACLRPETILTRGLAGKIGRPLDNSTPDSFEFIRDFFIVRDTKWFGFFWLKRPCFLSSSGGSATMTYLVTEPAWKEAYRASL